MPNTPLGLPFGLKILDDAPIDNRFIWDTLADLIAAPAGIKYEGMFPLYIKDEQAFYYLDDSLAPVEFDAGSVVIPPIPGDISDLTDTTDILPGLIAFDGDRIVKRPGIPNVNPGGTTLEEFLENYFYPFVMATIAITNGASIIYEQGTSNDVTVAGFVTSNDETSFSSGQVISPSEGDAVVDTFIAQPGSFSIVDAGITAYKTYRALIDVDGGGSPDTVQSGLKTIEFLYPFFWGMHANVLLGADIYASLTKSISKQGTKYVTFNDSLKRIYFAYPASYPDLSSVIDPNGYEVISSFTKLEDDVVSAGLDTDWTVAYKIYSTEITTVNSGQFKFLF